MACVRVCTVCVCKQDPEVCQCCEGAFSLRAAGGSAGLFEPHGFTQPACKVDLVHFWSFDERMTLFKK